MRQNVLSYAYLAGRNVPLKVHNTSAKNMWPRRYDTQAGIPPKNTNCSFQSQGSDEEKSRHTSIISSRRLSTLFAFQVFHMFRSPRPGVAGDGRLTYHRWTFSQGSQNVGGIHSLFFRR